MGVRAGPHSGRIDHIRACPNVPADVIDLHSHVLPGIDDGPPTIEGSLALARAAAAAGTGVLLATPHVNSRYRNDATDIAAGVRDLNARLRGEGVATADGTPLEVRPGAEIALTLVAELAPEQLAALSLGGGPWLLVEPPFAPVAPNLDAIVLDLLDRGHRILLAHPERCPALRRDPRMLRGLVNAGVLTSVTAGSLVGHFGGEARDFALELARGGMLHNVASDAHDELHRPPVIAADVERAGLGPLARWLTVEVPTAILEGGEIPARPVTPALPAAGLQRRSRWRLRGR